MKSEKIDNLLVKILTETADPAEKEDFENWLNEAEENKARFQRIRLLWDRLNGTYNTTTFDEAAAKRKILTAVLQNPSETRLLNRRFLIPAAAALILLLGLGMIAYYFFRSGPNEYQVYQSDARIKEIILSDGSHVWLNGNSTLRSPATFSENQRKVAIEGEGYFEVTKDEASPFKVRAGNTVIKVLGTSFNVKAEKENQNVSVTVSSGKVTFYKIISLQKGLVLSPGSIGQYTASDRRIKCSILNDQNILSWKTGVLTFHDTPIDEVCNALSRHYRKRIKTTLGDTTLTLTGRFQQESLEEVLKTIELTLDVSITVSDGEYIIRK
jgi:transmembrane sensor